MSWDVELLDANGDLVTIDRHSEGGTYVLGGTHDAALNVTYNYGGLFRQAWDGVGFREMLDGKRSDEVLEALRRGVEKLGTQRSPDYWEASEGNAGHALATLVKWAEQHPTAVFRVI